MPHAVYVRHENSCKMFIRITSILWRFILQYDHPSLVTYALTSFPVQIKTSRFQMHLINCVYLSIQQETVVNICIGNKHIK